MASLLASDLVVEVCMRSHAGDVLVCAIDGMDLSGAELAFFEQAQPAGVTLFARNIPSPYSELKKLTSKLQGLNQDKTRPVVISIDQEGGRVSRIRQAGFPDLGPALHVAGGACLPQALEQLRNYGEEVGRALLQLGVNVNFAPVTDILTEPLNQGIGDRVFGTTADAVILRAGAYLRGLQVSGVKGCLKHFPGQGNALVDTHLGRAEVHLAEDMLWQRELMPFAKLVEQVELVMMAHCVYPAIDTREASRSPIHIQNILQNKLAFQGVVVSDDMTMGAIPQGIKLWQEALIESITAGVDMLLICKGLDRFRYALEALQSAAAKSKAFAKRLEQASEKVSSFRRGLVV